MAGTSDANDAQGPTSQTGPGKPDKALPASPPAIAGAFSLLEELGSGSSGTVYRARLTNDYGGVPTGQEVAVKFLRQDRLSDERALARFRLEGSLGQRVRHPNVARIYGVETIPVLGLKLSYLVMELVQGTTLRSFLGQQGPPVEDLTRRIGADAAAGLHALHQRALVHRDIKPENLVLTWDDTVKIVDLGLARRFTGARGTPAAESDETGGSGSGSDSGGSSGRGIAGSLSYSAPETLQGGRANPRSDIYSLGVVLYELATGRHPFADAKDTDAMIHAHLHQQPARPSHYRPRMAPMLEQLLLDMLAKEPHQRPTDAAEVERVLREGEASTWWRQHEQRAPLLASRRRLQRMRRPTDTPFVGREPQRQLLDRLLRNAKSGTGQALCITGPRGIGRRRLLDEAMSHWLDLGFEVLYLGGEADPGLGHAEPFASSLLDWLLRDEGADTPHAQTRAIARARVEFGLEEAEAESLIAVVMGHSAEAPEVRANRLAKALLKIANRQPTLVLRVDGVDQLDTSGLLTLQRLLTEAPRQRMLLLATAGPDWETLAGFERVDLQGLSERHFATFGERLLANAPNHEEQLARAYATFSGSPGNLIEALEHLVQTRRMHGRPGRYVGLDPEAELRPAPGLLDRFTERLTELPADESQIIAAAAVLGIRSALADLVALTGAKQLQVLKALSRFRGRILRAQGGKVTFLHRDFQQAAQRQLPAEERKAMHRAAAAILQEREAPALEVGLQLSQALDHEGCIEPLLQGLEERVRAASRRTSLRIAARISVHLQSLPKNERFDRNRLRHLLLSARARRNAGQPAIATELCRDADSLAHELDDRLGRGEALTGLAQASFEAGHLMQAIAMLENAHRALADGESETARTLAAEAHGLHARTLLYLGQSEAGSVHLEAALRNLPDSATDLQRHLLIDRARLEALRHDYAAGLKTLNEVASRETLHLPRVRMRHLLYRGELRLALGEEEEAAKDLRASMALAARLALPAYQVRAQVLLAEQALRNQRHDEARRELVTARPLAQQADDRVGVAMVAVLDSRLGIDRPDLPELLDSLGLPSLSVAGLLAQAEQARAAGDKTRARAHAQDALELCDSADIPLALHLQAIMLADSNARARAWVRSVAESFTDRRSRRRFLRYWDKIATR